MKYLKKMGENRYLLIILAISIVFLGFFLYKIGSIPGLFIDETNYMNEVISETKFSTDINGLHDPVYFGSVWGQGQSVLYSWIVLPVVKLFGFTTTIFRLPMAILTFVTILSFSIVLYTSQKDKLLAVCVLITMLTSPWIFISGRWVLDTNIAPVFVALSLITLFLAINDNQKNISRLVWIVVSGILLGLSAYGYIAAWIYLPILVMLLTGMILIKRWLPIKLLVTWLIIILIMAIPLIVFAYRVNVQHINHISKFLFFEYPYLRANRTSSLVDMSNGVITGIKQNMLIGAQQFFLGTDNLTQNSVAPFGVISIPTLLLGFFGFFIRTPNLSKKAKIMRTISLIGLVSFIPCMMVIKANYNHWNLLWMPMLALVGFGLFSVISALKVRLRNPMLSYVILFLPIAFLTVFVGKAYFGFDGSKNFFNNFNGSYEETREIDSMMSKKYPKSRLYMTDMSSNFAVFRLVRNPISSTEYVVEKGPELESKRNEVGIGPETQYDYLRDYSRIAEAKSGDIAMVFVGDENYNLTKDKHWHVLKKDKFNHHDVCLVQKV